jgi:cytochrome o ubiquinol oxidase subunit 1
MVVATMGITLLAFTTWLHHFFTMGSGADVNAFFGITTMVISIPTGVKVFNWLFTMYGGRIRYTSPVLWTIGFMITFTIGGMTGVLMAVPPVDFVLHNSLFLVAHFHNVVIGGVVFGCMAGLTYWFPKAFGFTLDETLGKAVFWCWFIGFYLAFMPLYVLGFLGMPRRMNHYDNPQWTPYLYVAVAGAALILVGIALQGIQLFLSIRTRHLRRDLTGDPWQGRTLEWATVSPPPVYNFAVLPVVHGIDAYWASRHGGESDPPASIEAIEMPNRSSLGFVTAFFAVAGGFGMVWHIYWLGAGSLLAALAYWIWLSRNDNDETPLPAREVEATEHVARLRTVRA